MRQPDHTLSHPEETAIDSTLALNPVVGFGTKDAAERSDLELCGIELSATEHVGSWWPCWADWLKARGVGRNAAPVELGNAAYPPLCDAPETYVFE